MILIGASAPNSRRWSAAWLLAFVVALQTVIGCHPVAPPLRNLVLISIDTLVPQRMSVYGGPRRTTPAIDALATQAVRFDNAFSPAPWTLPAHASMFTGLYPSSLAKDPTDKRLYQVATMLSDRFRAAGYHTGAVVGGGFVSSFFGFGEGFDELLEPGPKNQMGAYVDQGMRDAVTWIEGSGDEKFFFFFHTFAAHEPYRDTRFVPSPSASPLTRLGPIQVCCTPKFFSRSEIELMQALYDGGVAKADEIVAEILAALSRVGLTEETAIIITSDHGQEFWSHTHRGGHGHTLYAHLLRVPLIWYEPGLASSGRVVETPVSLVDIVPTLVARFDLPAADDLDGVDISALLEGDDWTLDRAFFGEAVELGPSRYSVRTARAKLIETPDPNARQQLGARHRVPVRAPMELYLPDDTKETRNVASDVAYAHLLEEHAELLESHRAAATTAEPHVPLPETTEPLEQQLRALGYVE